MAYPVLEDWTEYLGSASESSMDLDKPADVQVGELLLLLAINEDSTATQQFTDNVTLFDLQWEIGSGTSDCHIALYSRIATGAEGATVNVPAQSSDYMMGYYLRISGVDPINFLNALGTAALSSGSPTDLTGLTTDVPECLCFYVAAFDGGDGTPVGVSNTGWSESDEGYSAGGSSGVSACFGTKQLAGAGPAGTATITWNTGDGNCGRQFAIAPALAGITSISPEEFDFDTASIDINGKNFEASQGGGTVYLSDADTLAGSANEVEIANGVNTWSDTVVNLDLTGLNQTEIDNLNTLGPGTRYLILVNNSTDEYGSDALTVHRIEAFVMSASPYIAASGENTTPQLIPPATKTTGEHTAGRIQEDENPADTVDIATDYYAEMEWCFKAVAAAREVQYSYRVTVAGTPIGTYTETPKLTISSITLKSVGDVGGGADVLGDILVSLSVAEAGGGADALGGPDVDLSVADTGGGTDVPAALISITIPDVGSGADAIDVINRLIAIAETGGGIEGINIPAIRTTISDVGSGADAIPTIQVDLTVTDTGGGIEAILRLILVTIAEVGTGTDALGQISISLSVADAGAGADALALAVSLGVADTGGGIDAVDVDTGAILKQIADAGSGSDVLGDISVSLAVSDTGGGTEAIGLNVSLTVTDVGAGLDEAAALLLTLIADVGSGADAVNVPAITITVDEVGDGSDALSVSVSLSIADVGGGTDDISVDIGALIKQVADSGLGTDGIVVAVNVPVPEVGSGLDVVSIAVDLSVTDVGSGSDSPYVSVLAAIADAISGVDAIGPVQVLVPIQDTITGADIVSQILAYLVLTDTGTGIESIIRDTGTQLLTITFAYKGPTTTFAMVERSTTFTLFKQRTTTFTGWKERSMTESGWKERSITYALEGGAL